MSKVHDVILDYLDWLKTVSIGRDREKAEFARESLDKLKKLIAEHDPKWMDKIRKANEEKGVE